MNREDQLDLIRRTGVVGIVRGSSPEALRRTVDALYAGGLRAVEVTFDTPGAVEMIGELVRSCPDDLLVGAGTVLDAETARAAILAGASFILTPALSMDVIATCHRYSRLVVPGVFTPTEALAAWQAGVQVVKLFPAGVVGPQYLRDLRGPLPQIAIMPVGGVSLDNAADFIRAGACALGVGGELVDKQAVKEGRYDALTLRAAQFLAAVESGRRAEARA